ncbi:unnamed protein product [Ilex paraguariensis]|uniref:Plant heme peroxidase family profile domain-containing protein n=1 Tax=Ilex paraguariensis TaxID=185542 RepID=A0ABC8UG41_9AQUA
MAMPVVNTEYLKEIDKARRDLRALISRKNCAPIMLRLAWHDAGTYDVNTKTGGPNGSIRNEEELLHGANSGLKIASDLLLAMAMPVVNTEYLKEIDKARRDLRALISRKNCAPIMLRLA